MIQTIETLVLLLVVIAAVAVVAARSKIPPAILLVLTGVVLALVPGLPSLELAPVSLQSPPDFAARRRQRRVHDRDRGGGDPLAPGVPLAHRLPAGRHRLAARRGGAALDRAPDADPAAHPRRARRRGAGERRHGTHFLSLRARRGEHGPVLARSGGRDFRRHRR